MTGPGYDDAFYDETAAWSSSSAAVVVPMLVELVRPASVVDVGCGRGQWLAAFRQAGVDDVLGLDGPYVPRAALAVDPASFRAVDLEHPPELGRSFDLAVSVEVAEHLDPATAASFVGYLCSLAPVVCFSAAIPGQGGVHHVNEQWPAYWAGLFADRGFEALDVLRPVLWDRPEVAFFYAQNLVLYARADVAAELAERAGAWPRPAAPLALVHPGMVEAWEDARRARRAPPPSLRSLLRQLPGAVRRAAALRRR
jgi:SAM-dependent methyltransferase